MTVWFRPNHGSEFLDIGTVFQDNFRAKFEDCFMAEFITINDSLESCKKKNKIKQKLKFLD